jgi:hypothetical protein
MSNTIAFGERLPDTEASTFHRTKGKARLGSKHQIALSWMYSLTAVDLAIARMELDHRRMLQRARQQYRQRKRVVSLRHSSKYQVRGGLDKMIDEVIDQRTSTPLPVGLRRLFRTFDGTRTRNSRFLMYSESAVNHCFDLKTWSEVWMRVAIWC